MRLLIPERTDLVEKTLKCLDKIRLKESGRAFHGSPAKMEGELSGGIILTEEPLAVEAFHDEVPDGGVLVLSARPFLSEGNLVLFGTRDWTPGELGKVKSRGIHVFDMREVTREGLSTVTDAVMARVRGWPAFHLVLDLSVLDPAFGSGGSAGGFTSRELIYVVQRLSMVKNLHSGQVVASDGAAIVAAKVLAELL